MSKFDEYMDEYIENTAGYASKRRHTMSLPRIEFIRQVFDEVYQRGYEQAMEEEAQKIPRGRQKNG